MLQQVTVPQQVLAGGNTWKGPMRRGCKGVHAELLDLVANSWHTVSTLRGMSVSWAVGRARHETTLNDVAR